LFLMRLLVFSSIALLSLWTWRWQLSRDHFDAADESIEVSEFKRCSRNECSNIWSFSSIVHWLRCAILKAYRNRKWNRGTELSFDEFWVQIHGLTTQHLHYPLVNKTTPQDMQRIHSHLLSCIFWVIPCLTAVVVIVIVIVNQSSLYS
jgi:hypothetical protein